METRSGRTLMSRSEQKTIALQSRDDNQAQQQQQDPALHDEVDPAQKQHSSHHSFAPALNDTQNHPNSNVPSDDARKEKTPSKSSVSYASTKRSVDLQRKELELQIAQERANLELQHAQFKFQQAQAQAQLSVLEKKLEIDLAKLDEKSRGSRRSCDSSKMASDRLHQWVKEQQEIKVFPTAKPNELKTHTPHPLPLSHHDVSPVINQLTYAIQDLATKTAATCNDKLLSRIVVPRELPQFSGSPLDWLHFRNAYYETEQACEFTNLENVCRLRKCLVGEAKECVSALLMGNDNADEIMSTLELQFGRPEIIIYYLVRQIKKLPSLSVSYYNEIVPFSIKIKNCVAAAKTINQEDYLRSPELLNSIISKFPCGLISKWADYYSMNKNNLLCRVELLSRFLNEEAFKVSEIGANVLPPPRRHSEYFSHSVPTKPHVVLTQTSPKTSEIKCSFCNRRSNHTVVDCSKFKRALRKDRWGFVRKHRLCPKCLLSTHDRDDCTAPDCRVDSCGLPHHDLLHWPSATPKKRCEQTEKHYKNESDDKQVMNVASTPNNVLLKVVYAELHGPNGSERALALLDDGSSVTMIDEDLANRIGLQGCTESFRARGAWDGSLFVCQTEILKFDVSNENGDRFPVTARKIKGLNLPRQNVQPDSYEHLEAVKNSLCSGIIKPSLIIGQDNYHLLAPLEIIEGDPTATRTVLGWSVHGKVFNRSKPHCLDLSDTLLVSTLNQREDVRAHDDEMNDLMRRSFALDAIGISATPRQNSEDRRALDILDKTSKQVGNRWEVGLPWRNDSTEMEDSYKNAFSRLQGVLKKMKMNPGFQERYKERVAHLFDNDYAHVLGDQEDANNLNRIWYLPHFGVDNPNKKKLRLVFDAAAKSGKAGGRGKALNDYLLQGPDLLISLFGVLLRFRQHRIAVTGDIKDMFLRVKVRREDQDALRFLWKDDINSDKPTSKCAMSSVIFGACCSPFIAQYVKNKNARLYETESPRAVRSIVANHYVDDLMDSIQSEKAAIELVHEVARIHKQGGFEIRNWTSNNKKVLASLPESDLGPSAFKFKVEGLSEGERTLGLYWFPAEDTLSFDLSMKRIDVELLRGRKPSKREVLSIIMTIFDVQGFLAPLTIQSRILLQEIWRSGVQWDEQIKGREFDKWQVWLHKLECVKTLRIPRWYLKADNDFTKTDVIDVDTDKLHAELHVFCDASSQAYAAVAYWRMTDERDDVKPRVSFIASKSRVAPLKPISVPRLELQGAVLACRLANVIIEEHTIKPTRRIFWSDSSTVLHWIKGDARNYKPFVAHRLGEIDELSRPDEWHYVPSAQNAADAATKERVDALTFNSEWFHGPHWLHENESEWPKSDFAEAAEDIELKTNVVNLTVQEHPPVPDANRFSSWMRLLRSTATVLTFLEKCRKASDGRIRVQDLKNAETLLLGSSQLESFPQELQQLKENKRLSKNSRLLSLSPFLDDSKIIRVQGRIDATEDVSWDIKRPVILDGRNQITKLIVKHHHERAAHANNETVVNNLRQRYWIIHLRPTVRNIASTCQYCRNRKAKPEVPKEGALPVARVSHHMRPFSHCGVDLFGPLDVTVGRRHEKRYGVIFTCMTIRAIHLEIVHSLSTDALIMALRRMAARRGWPRHMYSDNGTNLRGAETELKKCLNQDPLQDEAVNNHMQWHFLSPLSPHMGGAWERLIRSVKTTLKVILKARAPKDEVLLTLFCEVENIVNSRPLSFVSSDLSSPESLTPNHFLITGASNLPLLGQFDNEDFFLRKEWRKAQRLADMYWNRWVKEALPDLLPRTRWQTETTPLRVGDVVRVVEPALQRNVWPLGTIEAVHPGKDGRVRVVDIRTPHGVLRRRPAVRVARIPVHGGECEH